MEVTIIATIVVLVMLGVLFLYLRMNLVKELVIAALMSAIWVIYYGYTYKGDQWIIFGVLNVFAWVAWTLGLVVFAQVYEKLRDLFKQRWKAILISGVVYLFAVNLVEWFGYNILKIQLTSSYEGLFGLPLMHGNIVMKVFYLTEWLIFIGIYEFVTKYEKKKRR